MKRLLRFSALGLCALSLAACGESSDAKKKPAGGDAATDAAGGSGGSGGTSGSAGSAGAAGASGGSGGGGASDGGVDAGPSGPNVDISGSKLYETEFKPDQADPAATEALSTQLGYLDTRVTPRGLLVVYLHGAGAPSTCGSRDHGKVLAAMGFHVMSPCYLSDYGVGNCGNDIGGCRLEAFEGVDHHSFIDVKPPNSIETRVVKGLEYLQTQNPEGDWTWFVDSGKPRWGSIIISGISHGASSSGVIGMNRLVSRVVMLSGPLDTKQAWLAGSPLTPIERFWGFSHTGDSQHAGHLEAFETMKLPGAPKSVDSASPPYGSQRLISSAPSSNGHSSTQAGGASPKSGTEWVFLPVWQAAYGALP